MYDEIINDSFETVSALLHTAYNLEVEARRYSHDAKRENELLDISIKTRLSAKEIYETTIRILTNEPKK